MKDQIPVIGEWYCDQVESQLFEVVAVDEQFSTIEIQYLGGEISEVDFDTWEQMLITQAEPPEDADVAYELSKEDTIDNDQPIVPENWTDPLYSIEPESFSGSDDF